MASTIAVRRKLISQTRDVIYGKRMEIINGILKAPNKLVFEKILFLTEKLKIST